MELSGRRRARRDAEGWFDRGGRKDRRRWRQMMHCGDNMYSVYLQKSNLAPLTLSGSN